MSNLSSVSPFAEALSGVLNFYPSLNHVAEWLGVDETQVQKWFKDEALPRADTLHRITMIMRDTNSSPEFDRLSQEFFRVLERRSCEVTPFDHVARGSLGDYMLGPLLEAMHSSLTVVPLRLREELILHTIQIANAQPHETTTDTDMIQRSVELVDPPVSKNMSLDATDNSGDKPRSRFAQALYDVVRHYGTERVSVWTGVAEQTMQMWFRDELVPRHDHLYRLIRILRDHGAWHEQPERFEQIAKEFFTVIEMRATDISPLGKQMWPRASWYAMRGLRDSAVESVMLVPQRIREELFKRVINATHKLRKLPAGELDMLKPEVEPFDL